VTGPSVLTGRRRLVPGGSWAELVVRRARRTPGRIGLVADGVAWTCHDLDAWSNRLARVLWDAGAGPGAVVACAMTRSARAILTLLAVAKTGAAHVVVDPALAPARAAALLADVRPAVVVTDVLAFAARADIVLDNENWLGDLACRSASPLPRHQPAGPAYLVHTSGSTGQPKAVAVGHHSILNLHSELEATVFPRDGQPRRVAHGLPLSFDASWNPLLWLAGGHEVHLLPDDVRTDPERYVRFVAEHRVTVVEAVPAHMTALLDAGLLTTGARPELLLMGGEAVSHSLWARLRAVPDVAAINLYGPTECTVFTTSCRVDERAAPAIGRPIGNTGAAVVDDELRPVPAGEPGELLISGACLALGYPGRPELTAERFVTAPYPAYRTGDLCRLLPDGHLEWLGRLDDQVKIRGHRVEPGEVEHALLAQPDIRQAVVVADHTADGARLVAYVVPDGDAVTGTVVRERLLRMLPGYLVPSAVVAVDALPVGRHGKVDRAALPPVTVRAAPCASLTAAEAIVAEEFRSRLGIAVVDAGSDFFALGGHSLSAAALAGRLRALGVPCGLRDVLRLRTVARIAELVPSAGQGALT
jgi:amino acid adenylation domain-containing protein